MQRLAGVAAVAVALCALMALHAPGHLSHDSLVQLDEGFSRKYYSWNPPSFSLFLGATYGLFGTTSAALLVSQGLLVVGTYRLAAGPSASIAVRVAAFLTVLAVPIVLIYAGILWKDVFFAHVALAGMAVLHRDGVLRRHLVLGALLLGAAATIRQQGMVLLVPLLVYALWLAHRHSGDRAAAGRILPVLALAGFFGGYALVNLVVRVTAVDMPAAPYATGMQLIQGYDIAGIVYREPQARLDEFAARPGFERSRFLEFVRRGYSPERIDFLESRTTGIAGQFDFGAESGEIIGRQWRALVMSHPQTYLAHRADVFGWMLGAHEPKKCLPFIDDISPSPPEVVERFGMEAGPHPVTRLFTPEVSLEMFRPYLFLAGGALATLVLLIWRRMVSPRLHRRQPGAATSDAAIPILYLAGLLYGLVHVVVGIACDFRYMYFPVLASIVTVAHVLWRLVADLHRAGWGRLARRRSEGVPLHGRF